MALITWQDILQRAADFPGGESPITTNSVEWKKAFKHFIKKHAARYKTLPKAEQELRIVNIIQLNLKANNGKFVPGLGTSLNVADPKLTWEVLSKKPGFKEEFESFLKRSKDVRVSFPYWIFWCVSPVRHFLI